MAQDADSLGEGLDDVQERYKRRKLKAEFVDPNSYKPEADKKWPPPPPNRGAQSRSSA